MHGTFCVLSSVSALLTVACQALPCVGHRPPPLSLWTPLPPGACPPIRSDTCCPSLVAAGVGTESLCWHILVPEAQRKLLRGAGGSFRVSAGPSTVPEPLLDLHGARFCPLPRGCHRRTPPHSHCVLVLVSGVILCTETSPWVPSVSLTRVSAPGTGTWLFTPSARTPAAGTE